MGEEHPGLKLPEASFRKDQLTTEGERPLFYICHEMKLIRFGEHAFGYQWAEYSPCNNVPGGLDTCDINWIDLPSLPNEALLLFIAECEEK